MNLRAEQRKIRVRSLYALGFCSFVLGTCHFVLPRLFAFPNELLERLAFVLRADLFILLWVLISVRLVSSVRFRSVADMGAALSEERSAKLTIRAAFLQNTLEQATLAVGAHLALATLIDGASLSLIVGAVILFGIGRIAFFAGYSGGAGSRAFGMVVTVIPTLAAFLWAIAIMVSMIWRSPG